MGKQKKIEIVVKNEDNKINLIGYIRACPTNSVKQAEQ